jgi:hypothetical protein
MAYNIDVENKENNYSLQANTKITDARGCQPDLNTIPESWRLQRQIQLPGKVIFINHTGLELSGTRPYQCNGVPDLLQVPFPSSGEWALTYMYSIDIVALTVCASLLLPDPGLELLPCTDAERWSNGGWGARVSPPFADFMTHTNTQTHDHKTYSSF